MKKIFLILVLLVTLSVTMNSYSQDIRLKDKLPQCKYGYLQLTLEGGFLQPFGAMNDEYYASGNAGVDLAVRVNPEVALFTEAKSHFLMNTDPKGPSASYTEWTVGPRYYFVSKYVKSLFFWEGAIGMVLKHVGSFTATSDASEQFVDSKSEFHMGVNSGCGAELRLTDVVYFTVKGKYNYVFGSNGSRNFITGGAGLTFKFGQ